jgi:hypothetical protein
MVVDTSEPSPFQVTITEAAAALRRLLEATQAGEIDADDPKGRALHRRLEGVVAAWEEAAQSGGGSGIMGE